MYETGPMSLKRRILCMVLSLPVLVKQIRIPESVHYFSEGGGSRSNVTDLQFHFPVPHTGIYIGMQHHSFISQLRKEVKRY